MQENTSLKAAPTVMNTDTGLLRVIAIITMICDHVGIIFFPQNLYLRMIGRIAFPLFCWGIVVGCLYTRDWRRYALRLLMGGLISQWPYMMALSHSVSELNVMFTLLLGMLAITAIQHNKAGSIWWGPALCLSLAAVFQMDYGWRGVLLMIFMYLCRQHKGAFAAMMVSFSLFWGATSSDVSGLLGVPVHVSSLYMARWLSMVKTFLKLQGLAALSLLLMLSQTKSRVRLPKAVVYLAYPGHMLALYLLKLALG